MTTKYSVTPLMPADYAAAAELWNTIASDGETLYEPIDASKFPFASPADGAEGVPMTTFAFAAKEEGSTKLVGWIHGAKKRRFLNKETHANTPGYLTSVLVAKEYRGQGIGTALLDALKAAFRAEGKSALVCSDGNPVNLPWFIPGSPRHDHNNAPGVDESCAGYGFLLKNGFTAVAHEIAMYMPMSAYRYDPSIEVKREELLASGIRVGRYDLSCGDEFDSMCDRVGSEYWRNVLRTEIAAWKENRPNAAPELWPDGIRPSGPRILLTATTCAPLPIGHIVGFTGPVGLQKSGRGWFTGICVDPEYGGRGIATVLFNLLMREFVDEGAAFCTLFTGVDNHAQKIYSRAGLNIAARFAVMKSAL